MKQDGTGMGKKGDDPRPRSLRVHLVVFSLALLVPSLGLGTLVLAHAIDAYQMAHQQRLMDSARALGLAVDREIGTFLAISEGLATSPLLDATATDADHREFYHRAKPLGEALGTWVSVIGPGPDYRHIVHTGNPVGALLPAGLVLPQADAPLPKVFATGRPAIGGVARRQVTSRLSSVVIVPVVRDGKVIAAVAMPLDPVRLQRLLQTPDLTNGVFATVMDERNIIVAQSRDHETFAGRPVAPWLRDAMAGRDTGVVRGPNAEQQGSVTAFARLSLAPGWTIAVSESAEGFSASWLEPLRAMAGGAAIVVVLAVFMSLSVARRLLRPVIALATDAAEIAALAASETPPLPRAPPSSIAEIEDLRKGFIAAATALQARVATERRAAEVARRSEVARMESEGRFARAVEAAHIGTWEWDAATDRLTGSPGREALYGLPPGAMPNRAGFLAAVHQDDREATAAAAALAVRGENGGIYNAEFRVTWPDGTLHWLHTLGRVEFDASGAPVRMSGAVVDVTDRRNAEEAYARLNQDLAERVREEIATREAAQRRAALAERMQALGQLAGGVAHDLNNVLQAVHGSARMLQDGPDAGRAGRFIQLILDASERGASVTRRLLSFAHQSDLKAESFAVSDLLQGLREILLPTFGASIAIDVDVKPDLPDLLADRSQVETVLINIASNSRDAMPQGGTIVLAAHEEDGPIELLPVRLAAGRYIRLSVRDGGTGIPSDIIDRVTEPFFTTKGSGRGTGLGLSMARGFAEQSGGGLSIESLAGQGTVVTLWLPQAPARHVVVPTSERPTDKGLSAPKGCSRILLVEDDDLVREALSSEFVAAGCAVSAKRSGEEAIAAIVEGEQFDALVTDLSMPGMDGLAVIRAVQARRPDLPAVLLTGYAGDDAALAMTGSMSGSFSLLRKPVRMALLLERLQLLLAQAGANAACRNGEDR